MKIVILNGSPKGDQSLTMQYMKFIEKHQPGVEFKYLNIAQTISHLEKDEKAFQACLDSIREAHGVIWAFPLYFMMVIAEYKRFIELIFERGQEGVFQDKYAAVFTTSINFYDHTAHQYMREIIFDLQMKFVGSYSAKMMALLDKKQQKQVLFFGEHVIRAMENNEFEQNLILPLPQSTISYESILPVKPLDPGGKKIVVVTDRMHEASNPGKMILRLKATFGKQLSVLDLSTLDIKGGCLGCIRCGYNNQCIYEGKDDYIDVCREKIFPADILIFAGTIRDRYLSSTWKRFFDRSFFRTHTPRLVGKQLAYLISGPLSGLANLREILSAHAQLERANLAGMVSDEDSNSRAIDTQLDFLARKLLSFSAEQYQKPMDFLGVGGTKIFRDDMYGELRFPFIADYKYYKKHKLFDFPQKNYKVRIQAAILRFLSWFPFIRKEIYHHKIKEEMLKPLKKVVDKVSKEILSKN